MRERTGKRPPRVKFRHPETGEAVFASQETADRILGEASQGLGDMTKAELVEYAESNGLDVDTGQKKADLLAAIEAAE